MSLSWKMPLLVLVLALIFIQDFPVMSQVLHKAKPCSDGKTYCETVDDYPSEHVTRLLKKVPDSIKSFFQSERKHSVSDDLKPRSGGSIERPLCLANAHTVYPKVAKDTQGEWLHVMNQDEFIQGVRVETCINEGECYIPGALSHGYRSQCKQQFITRSLAALNGSNYIITSFLFPSCCSCVISGIGLPCNR